MQPKVRFDDLGSFIEIPDCSAPESAAISVCSRSWRLRPVPGVNWQLFQVLDQFSIARRNAVQVTASIVAIVMRLIAAVAAISRRLIPVALFVTRISAPAPTPTTPVPIRWTVRKCIPFAGTIHPFRRIQSQWVDVSQRVPTDINIGIKAAF